MLKGNIQSNTPVSANTNRSRNSTSASRAVNKDAGPTSFQNKEKNYSSNEQFYYGCDGKQMKINASPRTKDEFMKQKSIIAALQAQVLDLKEQLAAKDAIIESQLKSPEQLLRLDPV